MKLESVNGNGVCLSYLTVYLAIYVKLVLVVGMTKQMSEGKKVDMLKC